MKELIVVMPTYNEQGAIASVARDWYKTLEQLAIDFELRIYNDGSRDSTRDVLDNLKQELPRLQAIHKANSGHGPTILMGYMSAARESEWIFQTDSDGEMGPGDFGALWKDRNNYDFLAGFRHGRESPLPRQGISLVSRLTVWGFYGRSVWDVNSPYRLMRSSAFVSLFSAIPANTFAPNLIVSGYVGQKRLRFAEKQAAHRPRATGEVSIRKWKLLKAAFKSFKQTIAFRFKSHA
jgi:dolichol-phosphate mannosyltransferase